MFHSDHLPNDDRSNGPASAETNLRDLHGDAIDDFPVKVAVIPHELPGNCDTSMMYQNVTDSSHFITGRSPWWSTQQRSVDPDSALSWEIGETTSRIVACQDYLALARRELRRGHLTRAQYIERRTQTLDTLRWWHDRQRRLVALDTERNAARLKRAAELLATARRFIPNGWKV